MSDDLERRLRDSLRAYAETVDAPEDDALPTRPATARPVLRRWRGAGLAAAAAVVVVAGSLVVLDARAPGSDTAAGPAAASASAHGDPRTEAPESAIPSGQALSGSAADAAGAVGTIVPGAPVPYVLSTHCGIYGADIGGVWFAADPPLVGEGGQPPPGWGNPQQPGTMQLLTADEAMFTDDLGHSLPLHRNEAARPTFLCE